MRKRFTLEEALQLLEDALKQKDTLHPDDELNYLVDAQIVQCSRLIKAFQKYPK